MPARSALAALLLVAAAAGGCAPSATPPATSTATQGPPSAPPRAPSAAPTPTAAPTTAPAPSGTLPLPTGFAVALEPGTYWSAPPFDLGFAFTLPESGWVAGHLNPEFVDIQQFEGAPAEGVMPERIISFAHPLEVHGTTIVDAAELTPAEAIDAWVERSDIETANVEELQILGGDAVRVDVHAPVPMLALFGGDDGTFRLDGAYDVRIVAVAVDGGLFLASVHAPAADLEAAWEQALPILESIDLGA